MTDKRRAEWKGAADFAEIAEALGVTTKQIFLVQNPHGGAVLVMFTATPDPDDTLIHSVLLKRDADDVLFIATPVQAHPGMWEQIVEQADRELPGIIEKAIEEEGEK